jgi:hypothetical protein
VAVIGGSPVILVAEHGVALWIEASELAIGQTDAAIGKSVIPVDAVSER